MIKEAEESILDLSEIVAVDIDLDVDVRDVKDIDIIKSAIGSECDYLVTGDKDILVIEIIGNMKILRTKKFHF